jgi:uncharacterized membrane protein (DUF485 family)
LRLCRLHARHHFGFILLLAYGKPLLAAPLFGHDRVVGHADRVGRDRLGLRPHRHLCPARATPRFDALTRQIVEDMQ